MSWLKQSKVLSDAGLPEAYKLLREILSAKPMTFQQIVEEGLRRHQGEVPAANGLATSSGADIGKGSRAAQISATFKSTTTASMAVKPRRSDSGTVAPPSTIKERLQAARQVSQKSARDHADNQVSQRFPDGHPFKSAVFLKTRVMRGLKAQQLLAVYNYQPDSSSSSTKDGPNPDKRTGASFHWALTSPRRPKAMDGWTVQEHWDQLCNGTHPGEAVAHMEAAKARYAKRAKAMALEKGRDGKNSRGLREEADILGWAGREPELSTRKERTHLSKRRQRTRADMERATMLARKEKDATLAYAQKLVGLETIAKLKAKARAEAEEAGKKKRAESLRKQIAKGGKEILT